MSTVSSTRLRSSAGTVDSFHCDSVWTAWDEGTGGEGGIRSLERGIELGSICLEEEGKEEAKEEEGLRFVAAPANTGTHTFASYTIRAT